MLLFQMALAQHDPACQPGRLSLGAHTPINSLPLIVCAFIFESVQFCEVCV